MCIDDHLTVSISTSFFQRENKRMDRESSNHTPRSTTSVSDIAALQKEIMDLQNNSQACSEAQMISIKAEVAALKSQLNSKGDLPIDSNLVKLLLKNNIRYAEERNNEQLVAMKAAVGAINIAELENKTTDEMSRLKEEMAKLKQKLQEREDDDRTRVEIRKLKADVAEQLKAADGNTEGELKKMMISVECMANKTEYQQTKEELEEVKKELAMVKAELKETEKASKVRLELVTLKKSLEMELLNSQGMNKKEIKAIKSTIKRLDKKNIEHKTFDELSVIRRDVRALKEEVKKKEESSTVLTEISELKQKITGLLAASEGKSKEEMIAIKTAIDSISARQLTFTDKSELENMRTEIDQMRQEMAAKEEADKIKQELAEIKESLQSEIVQTKNKNREAFEAIRQTFANIKSEESHMHVSSFVALTSEVKRLKEEIEEQNRANCELAKLQRQLTEKLEMLGSDDEDNDDLVALKKAVDAVAAFDAEEDSETILDDLTSLKNSIKEAEENVHSAKDLEIVKLALEKKLQSSDGKSNLQIEEIISVVENIDLRVLGEKPNQTTLKTEIKATKHALKTRELYGVLYKLEGAFKEARSALTRMAAIRYRREINQIKTEAENDKQTIEKIEENIVKVNGLHHTLEMKSGNKKEKRGLRKFFSKLVGRVKPSTSNSVVCSEESSSTIDTVKIGPDKKPNVGENDYQYHENMATNVDDFIEENLETASRSRFSLALSQEHSQKSKKSKFCIKPEINEDQPVHQNINYEARSTEGPPAEVSVDISDDGSVVSLLSRQFGDVAFVRSYSSKKTKRQMDTDKVKEHCATQLEESDINGEKDNDLRSLSSKHSKHSFRSATSSKSSKPVLSKICPGSSKKYNDDDLHTTTSEGKKLALTPKVGMPPLYPTKQPSRAPISCGVNDHADEEESIREQNENDVPHDDERLDGRSIVSVAMVHHNEQGEFDIETIVESNYNDAEVPLTMSI